MQWIPWIVVMSDSAMCAAFSLYVEPFYFRDFQTKEFAENVVRKLVGRDANDAEYVEAESREHKARIDCVDASRDPTDHKACEVKSCRNARKLDDRASKCMEDRVHTLFLHAPWPKGESAKRIGVATPD